MKKVENDPLHLEAKETGMTRQNCMRRDGYDVIVVGTGYGGAVASCRLAQAALKVCVLDKGRRWEPHEFPNSCLQVLRHTQFKLPWGTWGKDTLPYQMTIDGDCLTLAGAGLGGGSLMNAGVVVRTPQRTIRDRRWPKKWREDWLKYESLASAMTEAETVPHDFPKKRVMDIITQEVEDVEDTYTRNTSFSSQDNIQLAIRFKDGTNVAGVKQNGCIACGNCLHGCRYNAKNSTDKNYLAAAIQAGAEVRTETKALFLVRSPARRAIFCDGLCSTSSCECGVPTGDSHCQGKVFSTEEHDAATSCGRRWRVYLDDMNYISADFVVLAAGVLGTTEILLRSRERGLKVSERLGCGVSANGNTIAYASGCRAPTRGVGIESKELSSVPMSERPGPAICNSYTSSAGYTFQAAVIPKNMPYALLRAFTFKDCVSRDGLLYTVLDILWQQLKVWMRAENSHTLSLNMIGYDESDGKIYLDKLSRRLRFVAPHDRSMMKKLLTCQRLAVRLRANLFTSSYRSTSVHLLGGCNAASDPKHGVANSDGQVFDTCLEPQGSLDSSDNVEENQTSEGKLQSSRGVTGIHCLPKVHDGLYVCDGALVPCAVGVNPSFTITTIAERVARGIVRNAVPYITKRSLAANLNGTGSGIVTSSESDNPLDLQQESMWEVLPRRGMQLERLSCSCSCESDEIRRHNPAQQVEMKSEAPVIVRESLKGQVGGIPCSLDVIMHMGLDNHKDQEFEQTPIDSFKNRFGDSHKLLRGTVGGRMMISKLDTEILHVLEGKVDLCWVNPRTPFTQYMHYHLHLVSATGTRYLLNGKKEMHPYLGGLWWWQESTTLRVTLHELNKSSDSDWQPQKRDPQGEEKGFSLVLEGELRLSFYELVKAAVKLRGFHKLQFLEVLAGTLVRTYILGWPRLLHHRNQRLTVKGRARRAESSVIRYPRHVVHRIYTDDGVQISVQQWPSAPLVAGEESSNVVLLLNGYSTESYWLPTEPTDLVRTLLENGYEPWLLNCRLHPTHAKGHRLDLDVIAEYDIPAAVRKMEEIRGEQVHVHVVAHCVGGLMIHMAILGGYLPASKVASILCTNSSMFFRVTRSTMAKLFLPLMPISMAILGNNSLLSTSNCKNEEEGEPFNHRILRFIARQVPRTECCMIDSCSVFSGVFGNTFWHANVSPSLHAQQICTTPTVFPMSALPHIRQIILKGHLIHRSGREIYMAHPERLATPTTYINGGKELLVTKETGKLAQRFMKLHHPQFLHSHVIIPEFGHSDLLIGEHSKTHVFPHILKHLTRVRDGQHMIPQGRQQKLMGWQNEQENSMALSLWTILIIISVVTFYILLFR